MLIIANKVRRKYAQLVSSLGKEFEDVTASTLEKPKEKDIKVLPCVCFLFTALSALCRF